MDGRADIARVLVLGHHLLIGIMADAGGDVHGTEGEVVVGAGPGHLPLNMNVVGTTIHPPAGVAAVATVQVNDPTVKEKDPTVKEKVRIARGKDVTVRARGLIARARGLTARVKGLTVRARGLTVREKALTVKARDRIAKVKGPAAKAQGLLDLDVDPDAGLRATLAEDVHLAPYIIRRQKLISRTHQAS